ncbi:MAG: electron transport complex subunit RsxC, partial [Eubacteriaceae bacterium]
GTVKAVEEREHPNGNRVMSVVIESDGEDIMDPSVKKPDWDYHDKTPKELIGMIQEGGIVGIGGATFPTHVKLSIPPDKHVDTIILNGAECEPYITCDDHLMRRHPEFLVKGLQVIMYITGVKQGFIGIEDNKPEAIAKVQEACSGVEGIEVAVLKTKYPQGAEKQLINAITGREVPSGGLPADAGAVVCNVATASQIYITICEGVPFYRTMLTCTGSCIKEPATYIARIGDSFSNIIRQSGGFTKEPRKIISGGPMMGVAQFTTDVPVIKSTSGILCFDEELAELPEPTPCIRCGKCAHVCPMHLQPLFISAYSLRNRFDKAEEFHALDCIECGSCSYICPAKRPLVTSIRTAKRIIAAEKRKAK